jgi:hypothetical protein
MREYGGGPVTATRSGTSSSVKGGLASSMPGG